MRPPKRTGFFVPMPADPPAKPYFSRLESSVSMHAPTAEVMMQLGAHFAQSASAGSLFALIGDLGAGKTHWTKGFVHGMGSTAEVTSPTFGLLHEYPGGRLLVHHLDFYRMDSADEVLALGWDELLDQDAVLIAEWADRFPELFPDGTRWLHFSIAQDGTRIITESRSVMPIREPSP